MSIRIPMIAAASLLTASLSMAAPGPVAVEPAATAFKIGALEAVALHDANFVAANDGSVFGVDATTDEVAGVLKAAGAPTDSIALSVSALLVRDGGRVVLIDTGLGPAVHGVLMQSLAKAGVAAGDVTDVLITHVHGDHIGGLATADGKPAFPKAVVRMSSGEWTYMQGLAELAPLVKIITPQLKTFQPGAMLAPGIKAVAINGHTPGHTGYEISSGHDKLLDIGDTAHSSLVSLTKPSWAMGFDSDRAVAKASRIKLLTELSKSHETIFAPHFPYPGVGKIKAEGDHFAWAPALAP